MKISIKRKGLMKFGIISSVIIALLFLGFLFLQVFATPEYTSDINFNVSDPHREDVILAYANWNETANSTVIEYNSTNSTLGNYTNTTEITDGWTNFTITTTTSWLLGVHAAKIYVNSTVDSGDTADNSTTQQIFTLWGWANTTTYNNDSYVNSTAPLLTSCLVTDANTSAALSNYYVEIYNGTFNLTAGVSDANGWFNYSWVPGVEGATTMTCAIYDNSTQYYNVSANSTASFTADYTAPTVNTPTPGDNTYVRGTSSQPFSIVGSDSGAGIKSGTVFYKNTTDEEYTSQSLSSCTGSNPTCTATVDLSDTDRFSHGSTVQYYFKLFDNADIAGYNGTTSVPNTVVVDRNSPQYSSVGANDTVIAKGGGILLYSNWTDEYELSYSTLETNETGCGNSPCYNKSTGSMSGATGWANYSWSNSSVAAGTVVAWRIHVNDSAVGSSNENTTSTNTFTIDGTAPTWSSNTTSPANGTAYSSSATYQFNITWTDSIGVSDVVFEWDSSTNYTYLGSDVSKSGNEYYISLAAQAAGNYSFKWYSNDTSDNWNTSDPWAYTIVNASNPVDLYFRNSTAEYKNQNMTITYATASNATGEATAGTMALYRDESDVTSESGTDVTLAAKAAGYAYKVNATGNANYTDNTTGVTYYLIINNATPTVTLDKNVTNWGSGNTYPAPTNITGYESNSQDDDCTYTLYRNTTTVGTGSTVSDHQLLGAGSYVYVYNVSECTNYTSGSTTNTLVIDQGPTSMTLWVDSDGTNKAFTKERHTSTTMNLTAELNVSGKTVSIYRNGSLLSSGSTPHEDATSLNLAIGNYTYDANWTGDDNYTTSSDTVYVYINDTTEATVDYVSPTPADNYNQTSLTLIVNVTHADEYPDTLILYINDTENTTQSYTGTFTNITFTNLYGVYTYYVWLNDTNNNTNQTSARTIKLDNVAPTLNTPTPDNNSYIKGESSQTFSIVVSDTVAQVQNGTLNYKKSTDPEYSSTALSNCAGTSPTCTVDLDLSDTGTYPDGTSIQYYFKVYDYASNAGYNGSTTSPIQTTIDRNAPTYANNNTNTSTIIVGGVALIYTQWTDSYDLNYATLETNETGAADNKTTYSSPATLTGTSDWSNFTWDNDSVTTGTVVEWKIYANDSAGNENVTETGTFTIDGTAPQYDNESTSPTTPTQYAPEKSYTFNISWSDNIAISEVIFEANFTTTPSNYTDVDTPGVVSLGSNNYSVTLTDLPANHTYNYTYRWFANDTSNNWNNTGYYDYNVSKNETNPVDIYIVNSTATYKNQNVSIIYGNQTTANATAIYSSSGTANLYRDESAVSGATETVTLAGKTAGYAYLANVTGNDNYTHNTTGVTYYLFVNNATPTLNLYINESADNRTITYPSIATVKGNESNAEDSDVNYTLWRNETLLGSDLETGDESDSTRLGNGTHVFVYNTSGGANYSSASVTYYLFVNKGTPDVKTFIDEDAVNKTITYETSVTIRGNSTTTVTPPTFNLTIGPVALGSGNPTSDSVTMGVGTHPVVYNTSGNANWTSAENTTLYLIVDKMAIDIGLVPATQAITYETSVTPYCTSNHSTYECSLWRGESNVTDTENDTAMVYGAGTENFEANVTAPTANYSWTANTSTLTVNTKNANVGLSPANGSITYETSSDQYCTDDATLANCVIYRNETEITNATTETLGAGYWEFKANISDSTNYTNWQVLQNLTVDQKDANVQVFPATQTATYPTTQTQYCTDDATLTNCSIFRNDSSITNNTNYSPAVGAYAYKANISDTANYTNYEDTETLTVSKGALAGTVSAPSVTYPTSLSVSSTESNVGDGDVAYRIYCNETLVASATGSAPSGSYLFGVESYECKLNTTGDTFGNWTENSSIVSTSTSVSINSSTENYMNLTLGVGTTGTEADLTVEYPNTTNATGWFDSNSFVESAPSFTLWRNTTNVTSTNPVSDNVELGAGIHVYVYNTSGNTNYSSASKTFTLNVSKNQTNPVDLYLRNSTAEYKNQNMTITYATASNATAAMVYSERGSVELYRDETNVTDESGTDVTLAAKTAGYAYKVNATGNANYTDNSTGVTYYLIINKGVLLLAITSAQEEDYETQTTVTGTQTSTGDDDVNYTLWRDGTLVDSDTNANPTETNTLGVGTNTYTFNTTSGSFENYTANATGVTTTVTINAKSVTVTLGGITGQTITYETSVTPYCSYTGSTIETPACILFRDGTDVTSTENDTAMVYGYNATAYTFWSNVSLSSNYSYSNQTNTLTVNQKDANVAVAPTTQAITYETSIDQYCTDDATLLTCSVYRNGTEVTNATTETLGADVYSYVANISDATNYTNYQATSTLTVNTKDINIYTEFNTTTVNDNKTYTYPEVINATAYRDATLSNEGTLTLYRNDTDVGNETIRLGNATYNYTLVFTATNYTDNTTTYYVFVNKGTPELTLTSSPSWTPTDAQATTVTCSATSQNDEVSANLYRNGTDVNSTQNGIAQLFAADVYNYTCNTTATANYTTNSTSQTMTVTATKGSIAGYITDSVTSDAIQGATVYITGYSAVPTDANGYYLITDVTPGTYTVTVDKTGYTSNSTSSVTVTAGQTTQTNMTMAATDTTAPTVINSGPSGVLTASSTTIWAVTDESASCYYATEDKVISSMTAMGASGNNHTADLSSLANRVHNYFVRCNDTAGNNMNVSAIISFTINVTSTGSIEGYVLSSTNAAIEGVTVALNSTASSAVTSSTGYYAITDLDAGGYALSVSKSGYTTNSTVTATVTAGSTTTTNVTLAANDTAAPIVTASGPNGTLTTGTNIEIYATTDESSTCLYDTTDKSYSTMTGVMAGNSSTNHTKTFSSLSNGDYTYFVRCNDTSGNVMTTSAIISFTINVTDTAAPIVSSITKGNISSSSVWIAWDTDESATGQIYYGLTTGYELSTGVAPTATSQNITLSGLSASTTYYYKIIAKDASGNENSSQTGNFVTQAAADTTAPVVTASGPSGTQSSTSVTFFVTTDETSTCLYSSTGDMSYSSMTGVMTGNDSTNHTKALTGLSDLTTYRYWVRCIDSSNNEMNTSTYIEFYINTSADTTNPVINSVYLNATQFTAGQPILVTVNATDDTAVTSVTADGVALSNPGSGDIWNGTVTAASTTGSHSVVILAADAAGNNATQSVTYEVVSSLDTTNPVINSAYLNASQYLASTGIFVTVNVTDDTAVTSVTADGVALSNPGSGDIWNGTITAKSTLKQHAVIILATDAAGNNETTSVTYTIVSTLDTSAPNITASGPSGVLTASSTTIWAYSSENNVYCKYDTSAKVFANMSNDMTTSGQNHTADVSSLANRHYVYWVSCNDTADNTIYPPFTIEFTVNVTSTGSIEGYILVNGTNAAIEGAAVSVNATGISATTSGATGYYYITGLTAGGYRVNASKSGYTSNSSADTVTADHITEINITMAATDTTAPTVINSGPSAVLTASSTTIWAVTDESASCYYATEDKVISSMTAMGASGNNHTADLSSLANRVHDYYVRCNDTAGNAMTTSATISFTINVTSTGSIEGYVLDNKSSAVVSGAIVGVNGSFSGVATSSTGYYSITHLPAGVYTVTAIASSFDSNSTTTTVTADSTTTANVSLANISSNLNVSITLSGTSAGKWNNFWLPRFWLEDYDSLGANYSVENVLASLNATDATDYHWKMLYYHNTTAGSAGWTSYVPGRAVNDLTEFNDQDAKPYFIQMNATAKLRIA